MWFSYTTEYYSAIKNEVINAGKIGLDAATEIVDNYISKRI